MGYVGGEKAMVLTDVNRERTEVDQEAQRKRRLLTEGAHYRGRARYQLEIRSSLESSIV